MKKKKLLSVLLAGAMSASIFVGCGSSATDWDYISNKGELVIGVTYFEPMNYLDADGKLTGFETEFAEAVCEKMGVTPKFQKIDWDSKEVELNSKTIDCIWNGLTIDDDRKTTMDISTPYMENKQVMVAKSDVADKIKSADDLKDKTVVAEKKSAGETVAQTDEFFSSAKYVSVDAQAKALLEVKSGTADVAVIDYVMSIGTRAVLTTLTSRLLTARTFHLSSTVLHFVRTAPKHSKSLTMLFRQLPMTAHLIRLLRSTAFRIFFL
mgnify:CR=1 FL=1